MSNFQITPIGIGLIGLYSGIVVLLLVWPIARLLKNSRFRWPVAWAIAAPFLIAPWAEEAWIAWHFTEACKDAGVKVYRQVEVEGFYDGTIGTGYSFIENYGFRFMEEKASNGKIAHTERPDGQWITTMLEKPSARYHLIYAYQPNPWVVEEPIGWKLEKIERQAIDSQTGQIVGRDTLVHRGAPIADAIWARFLGNSMTTCPGPNVKPFVAPPPFPQAVLKPLSRQ